MRKVKTGGKTYKGTMVSSHQAKRALEFNSVSTNATTDCNLNSSCSGNANKVGGPITINCNGIIYNVYYNTTNIDDATGFCVYNNTDGNWYSGDMPTTCLELIYPMGTTCSQYI